MKYINPEHTQIEDGNTSVPTNLDNRHYQAILVRVARGEVIDPFVAPVPTPGQLRAEAKIKAVDAMFEQEVDEGKFDALPDVIDYRNRRP